MVLGTFVNCICIITGGLAGVLLGSKVKKEINDRVLLVTGLCVASLGLKMAIDFNTSVDFVISLLSIAFGTLVGELMKLDKKLNSLAHKVQKLVKSDDGNFSQGLIVASMTFCIGSMGILGSIQEGVNNDTSILMAKAVIDGIVSFVLASSLGLGVLYSAVAVLFYQGSLTLLAGQLKPLITVTVIANLGVAGGVIVAAIGLSLMGLHQVKTTNMLPAIALVIALTRLRDLWI